MLILYQSPFTLKNMKVVFFLSVAVMACLALHVYFKFFKSKGFRKQALEQVSHTSFIPAVSSSYLKKGSDGKNLIGGGSGFYDDRPSPDFRPRGWPFFFSEAPDSLFWYDLQWEKPEEILLFPKQWYEDEELAFAWNAILAKQRGEKSRDEVNDNVLIKQFHYHHYYLLTYCEENVL